MNIIRLSSTGSTGLMDRLFAIYKEALPPHEQKPRFMLDKMLENTNYYFYILTSPAGKNQPIGMAIIYAPGELDYYLLEYIAIAAGYRGGGYGGKFFDALVEIFKGNMVVEIDSPYQHSDDTATRLKRREFYKSHGCVEVSGLKYILPLKLKNIPEMLLMLHSDIYKHAIPKEKLRLWLHDIYEYAYGCSKNDERVEFMLDGLPGEVVLLGG